jgi:23S rRNA (cytosine1962-C5)-methyltransferase
MKVPQVILLPGREKSLLRKHPWIFSGAIKNIIGDPEAGASVEIVDANGNHLGIGAFSGTSKIRVRMWTFDPEETIDQAFFHRKINQSLCVRENIAGLQKTNAMRIVFGENDGLPGVIADQYGEVVVLQLSSAGAYYWRDVIIAELVQQTTCACLYEKSDADILQLEGLHEVVKMQHGSLADDRLIIEENGIKFSLDILDGQKTGYYLDQRNNRSLVAEYSSGKKLLDCFCFSGGFSLNALAAGAASVTAVDSSSAALQLFGENIRLNSLDPLKVEMVNDNVFEYLRKLRDRGLQYDVIVLDPPKFAPTASQAERAARAYKDINMLAFKLLASSGILCTFSCSGGVSLTLFQKIVADAALDAGRSAQIIKYLHQAEDHPISMPFPEGEYLKGLICSVK